MGKKDNRATRKVKRRRGQARKKNAIKKRIAAGKAGTGTATKKVAAPKATPTTVVKKAAATPAAAVKPAPVAAAPKAPVAAPAVPKKPKE